MLTNTRKNPLRVLHVVGNSRFGGAGWIILGLGRIARAQGWQVDVLTTDPVFQRFVREQGLGLVNLDVIRREIRPAWDFAGLLRLRDFLRRENYGIVHTHTSKGGFVGRLAASLAKVPVIVHTVHGFAFHERSSPSALMIYCALERIATRWCDRIVSVSEFHRHWALELGICKPREILAIPNGVADSRRIPPPPAGDLRRSLGAHEGDILILSMCRLAADKGLGYLIAAAARLAGEQRRYRIVIAGEGPELTRLQRQARDLKVAHMVAFLGFREDIDALLAACDMVVLPSLREGLSIALLEAMAAGKPIVATDIASHREVVSQADIARIVPVGDSNALAEAILGLAGDQAMMLRLGIAARGVFERHYTEERMLDAYRRLYFELLEQKCPEYAVPALRGPESRERALPELDEPVAPGRPKGGGVWNER
jgi:glycosyltransferase involved in cell wall biosynthesis